MDSLFQDVRYAIRTLLKAPAFTIAAVLVLAIGIGATTAIFSVVDALILRPLPFHHPERVVAFETSQRGHTGPISVPDFHSIHDRASSFELVAATRGAFFTLAQGDSVEQFLGLRVSSDFFRILDGPVVLGRTFSAGSEARKGHEVVLSYGLWQRLFSSDPKVVGSQVDVTGEPAQVIGVMSKDYVDDTNAELWVLSDFETSEKERGLRSVGVAARLKAGVSLDAARLEMAELSRRLAREFPETNTTVELRVLPFQEQRSGDSRKSVLIMLGAILLVLVIGCANVANLVLARATGRRTEIAVRAALGATPGRIVRQLLTESVVLALFSAAIGLLIASSGIDLLVAGLAPYVPHARRAAVDLRALGVSVLLSLATAIAFGLFPAIAAVRGDLQTGLGEAGAKASAGAANKRLRSALVVVELALALVLVAGAGILVKTYANLNRVERGFDPHGVSLFVVELDSARYPTDERRTAFVEEVLARLRAIPGVRAASASGAAPILQGGHGYFEIEGRPFERGHEPLSSYNQASPGFDKAIGMRLVEGRFFDAGDVATSHRVALVNATLAKRFFPGENAIGKRVRSDWGFEGQLDKEFSEIVGVFADMRSHGLREAPLPETLFALSQHPNAAPLFLVRADIDAARLQPLLRAALREVDPHEPFDEIQWARDKVGTYDAVVGLSLGNDRFNTGLLTALALVALLLAAVGVSGVTAYGVAQRQREFGIRMALGATPTAVVGLVVRQNARLVLAATVIGLGVAVLASRLLASLVFEVSPLDPVSLVGAAFVLAAVALFAAWLPARRATRLSPTVALRAD